MKNADMPAMPIVDSCGEVAIYGNENLEARGITKREMMAMHMMQGLVSAWGNHDVTSSDELASDAVMMADSLLAALEGKQ